MPPFVKSAVRLWPTLAAEIQDLSVVAQPRLGTSVTVHDPRQLAREDRFDFQAVYGPYASQDEIFRSTMEELALNVWKGRVCEPFPLHLVLTQRHQSSTVCVYGGISSGKSHTLRGSRKDPGAIPRLLEILLGQPQEDDQITLCSGTLL